MRAVRSGVPVGPRRRRGQAQGQPVRRYAVKKLAEDHESELRPGGTEVRTVRSLERTDSSVGVM
jgi:hypothetical protein